MGNFPFFVLGLLIAAPTVCQKHLLVLRLCYADCPMGVDVYIFPSLPVVSCISQDNVGSMSLAVPIEMRWFC